MGALKLDLISPSGSPQPNFFDQRRIERALEERVRYRYVTPTVVPVPDGYRIESPCCSRNVDPAGGVVDVALLQYRADVPGWRLFRKEHASGQWLPHSDFRRLTEALQLLNADPDRQFWQ